MSSGRLGPRGGRRAAGAARTRPARRGRTGGPRPCRSPPARRRPRPRWCRAGAAALPELVQFDAEPDQVLQGVHVDVAGDDGAIAASQAIAAAASRPARRRRSRRPRRRARGGRPTAPAPARSTPLQGESPSSSIRSAREICAQALTGCPARSGSSPAAVSRRIASARASWYRWPLVRSSSFRLGGQRVQHRGDGGGALGGQVPVHTPAPPMVVASFTSRSANSRPGS